MNLAQLQRQRLSLQGSDDRFGRLPTPRMQPDGQEGGFRDTLKTAMNEVDGLQKAADNQITAFISGEQDNLHEVTIAMNQAQLSFQFMTEVRNKMLESYQELSRMQV